MAKSDLPSNVISFNEKLFQKVLRENETLQVRLNHLIDIARSNQEIQDHFDALEQKILKSRSLREMARIIAREIKKRFQMDFVTLCVSLDPEDVLWKSQDGTRSAPVPSYLRMVKPAELRSALPRSIRNPLLVESVTQDSGPFFATEELSQIRSGAVVPLFLSGKVIGTLNLGSRDPDRYTAEHGTDFLRRLGCKVSLIIDNIIAHQRLTAISVTDQLTGISNRRQFDAALGREMERAKRHSTPLACVAVDLDGFKEINDRFGHQVGDEALRHVGSVLRDRSRRYDVVARYGGDEFAILLPQTDTEGAVRVAEKFRREMAERPLTLGGNSTFLGLSIGVAATSEMPGCEPEDLVREADRRMYAAKKSGGNRIVSSPDS